MAATQQPSGIAAAELAIDQCYEQNLRGLDLSRMNLESLPPSISKLGTSLRRIDLSHNCFSSLPLELQHLVKLQSLRLEMNACVPFSISSSLAHLTELTLLKLAGNALSSFPDELCQLSLLSIIDVSNNNLEQLPSDMARLTRLAMLKADNNNLRSIPRLHGRNLNGLSLSFNRYLAASGADWFDRQIKYLGRLTRLELRSCSLSEWPSSVACLTNLRILDLGGNNIRSLPSASMSPSSPPMLSLSASNTSTHNANNLGASARTASNPKAATASSLISSATSTTAIASALLASALGTSPTSSSSITHAAAALGLSSPTTDAASSASSSSSSQPTSSSSSSSSSSAASTTDTISEASLPPDSLLRLSSLEQLKLDNNALTELPYEIGYLTSLTLLHVHKNPIVELPCSIHMLAKIDDCNWTLDFNLIQSPPSEVAAHGLRAIKDFMSDLARGSEPCYRIKLLLVGQENVGKSSLLRKLQSARGIVRSAAASATRDAYRMSRQLSPGDAPLHNISTDGIEIATVSVPTNVTSKRGDRVVIHFSVWDFAGQGTRQS